MNKLALILERQWLHWLLLTVLLGIMFFAGQPESCQKGQLWGVATPVWYWIAIGLAVAHQVFVWFCWRTQLHLGLLSNVFGEGGLRLYAVGFAILGIARTVAVFLLAIANRETFLLEPLLMKVLAVILLIPAFYLFYSVSRYFGFQRAFGADHFDESYRSLPMVKQGIFRFTDNGMYVFGFLLLWAPTLWWASTAALWVALFNHLYIWVHYHSTESPDMKRIYG